MPALKNIFSRDALGHPIVLAAIGTVVVIAVGSVVYYIVTTRAPASTWATAQMSSIQEVVTGTGTVEPAQNPDLAFESGGRVAAVNVAVGDSVSQGETLASLDTASLSAALAQAQASQAAAQADLDQKQAGARPTDIAAAQSKVAAAQQTLQNLYAGVPAAVANAYQTTYADVRADTDSLFSNPSSQSPTPLFQTTDSQDAASASDARGALTGTFASWQTQSAALVGSATSTNADLDAALVYSLKQLTAAQSFDSYLLEALGSATPSNSFSQSQLTAAQASVSALNGSINGLITSLQSIQQQIASAEIAVQSAQDALNQTLAGSTPQDIESAQAAVEGAQAGVESAQAALNDAIISAPFSGTVSSVAVKTGQIVTPNTIAVSLTPHSALQVEIYVSGVDAAHLSPGQSAQVTLDAYGTGRLFPATVASVDQSPSTAPNTSGYKVILQFVQNDPAITVGLGASVTIIAGQKSNVVVVPLSAVIQNNNQDFVLVPSTAGPIEKPITLGLESTDTAEVTSGLSAGDSYLLPSR
jgi:RND family efflux transporter MFP subunit